MGQPEIGAAIAGRVARLEVPLQHPLGVREAPLVLGDLRGGKEEDFRPNVLTLELPTRDLGAVLPERGRLGEPVVLDHSHSRRASPLRSTLALSEVAGFWPTHSMPFT